MHLIIMNNHRHKTCFHFQFFHICCSKQSSNCCMNNMFCVENETKRWKWKCISLMHCMSGCVRAHARTFDVENGFDARLVAYICCWFCSDTINIDCDDEDFHCIITIILLLLLLLVLWVCYVCLMRIARIYWSYFVCRVECDWVCVYAFTTFDAINK